MRRPFCIFKAFEEVAFPVIERVTKLIAVHPDYQRLRRYGGGLRPVLRSWSLFVAVNSLLSASWMKIRPLMEPSRWRVAQPRPLAGSNSS